ncbi:hypothetical protein TRIUR3_09038 [Triticum urartu]|uniref:Uncharacterized protein n=1 Tax=Triticum urartu TaxID=4572 RepID=M7ZPX6_TRIUA|nr:hypothetical protein TRIUR3_09038 [Triticum urartu]
MREKGIGAGTFWCAAADGCSSPAPGEQGLACLKNVDLDLSAMPTLEQVHAVIQHYGPTLYFHPKEVYLPSSVAWYFKNGAKIFKKGGGAVGEEIDAEGSNLPGGGWNDGEYWMDIPGGKRRQAVIRGDIESAELYAHVKPAMGGACTDVAMWVFCPFNGPARLKLGPINLPLGTTGQHVGDWEHFTLRVSNFTGELMAVYYSQHSGGSVKYRVVAAEYLGEGVVAEPQWLQFMREWGPTLMKVVCQEQKSYESKKGRREYMGQVITAELTIHLSSFHFDSSNLGTVDTVASVLSHPGGPAPEPQHPVSVGHCNEPNTLGLVVKQWAESCHESLVAEATLGHDSAIQVRVDVEGLALCRI